MPQAPAAQVAVPLAALHARPQAPQLAGVTRRSTSQPLAGLPSQSPKPVLQAATVHRPQPHAATALGRLQAPPQRPQCAVAVLVLVSQPLATLPSQSPKPAAQVIAQAPARHEALPFVVEQALPQRPQCEALARVSVSQPLLGLPSQSAKPGLHEATPQRPPAQVAVALGRLHAAPHAPQWGAAESRSVSQPLDSLPSQSPRVVGEHTRVDSQRPAAQRAPALGKEHAVPHAPQCKVFTRVSTSQPLAGLPSQSPKPAAQVMAQTPALHEALPFVDGQALPQRPQCAGALRVSTSQPLAGSPSQSAKPGLQAPTPQRPATHAPAALAGAQTMPQPPQLRASARASTSQPLVVAPSQSAKPSAHTGLHRPAAHTAEPLAGRSQRVVQVPQWSASVRVSTSQPLRSSRSQFAKPGSQTSAHRASAQVTRWRWGPGARRAAGAAVRRARRQGDLAAVGGVAVAVGRARLAAEAAAAVGAHRGARRARGADVVTPAAVPGIGGAVGADAGAEVRRRRVADGGAAKARAVARGRRAERRGRHAAVAAGAAVRRQGEVLFAAVRGVAVAVGEGRLADQPQRPASQVPRACAAVGHAMPQAPQWSTEVAVSVSQPLRSSLSQLPRVGSQTTRQTCPSTQRVKGLMTRQS